MSNGCTVDKKNEINPLATAFAAFSKRFSLDPADGILVAASGGVDSTVLAHFLFHAGVKKLALAHCNFKLRGADSDADEQAVKRLGETLGIPVFTQSFPAELTTAAKGQSVQMAARRLRYDWFEQTRKTLGFKFIATAHHANDQAETVLQHFVRGSGLSGLRGIPPVNGALIRPLLSVQKKDLEAYALEHKLDYRTDRSNLETDYLRNKIRLDILPTLTELNPSLIETLASNAERFRQSHFFFQRAVDKQKRMLSVNKNGLVEINIRALQAHPAGETLLFELLNDYGFNSLQSQEIFDALASLSGSVFYSDTHRVVKDRRFLLVAPRESVGFHHVVNKGSGTFELPNGKLTFETIANSPDINFENARYQFIDAGKLVFPLTLRPWRNGDYFYPIGLNKKKKVSDLFTDKKLSLLDKESQPILVSVEHVVALPGLTVDHRFRVTASTKAVLKMFMQ